MNQPNIYELDNGFIFLGGFLQEVFLTNKVDVNNEPILQSVIKSYTASIPKPTPNSLEQ